MYDAILFDLDGTLIDTERLAMATGRDAFAEFGHEDTEELFLSLIGVDLPTSAKIIEARFPKLDQVAVNQVWRGKFAEQMKREVPMKPFALKVVHGLAPRFDLGLVTSSERQAAMDKLGRSGLLSAFQTIVTREDVSTPKPAPAPYLLAAERLGVAPERCLAFEDSEPGAKAAHKAGMTVVQLRDVLPPSGEFAHHVADDLLSGLRLAGLSL